MKGGATSRMGKVSSLDRSLSQLTEDVARQLTRRRFLLRGVKVVSGTLAGLSIGSFAGLHSDEAAACSCSYVGCGNCSCRGKTCPNNGCPSGCSPCLKGDCVECPHPSGAWVCCSSCCGVCGLGSYYCYDCRCSGCGQLCGCKTGCLCSGCCTPGEVKEEFARIVRETGSAA
jgi:hypothetical protein